MLNFIWIAFILVGLLAALAQALQGDLEIFSRVLTGLFDSAKTGFDISIGLVGVASLGPTVGRLIDRRGSLVGLLPPGAGQKQVVVDSPPWVAVAFMLVRAL